MSYMHVQNTLQSIHGNECWCMHAHCDAMQHTCMICQYVPPMCCFEFRSPTKSTQYVLIVSRIDSFSKWVWGDLDKIKHVRPISPPANLSKKRPISPPMPPPARLLKKKEEPPAELLVKQEGELEM